MNQYVKNLIFRTELDIGYKNLTSEELIFFWIKMIMLIGSTTFLFMIGANMWLTLFGFDFQFAMWSSFLVTAVIEMLINKSGLVICVTIGVSGLLLYPFI